jgi:two-component system sensor histidine kinase DesK
VSVTTHDAQPHEETGPERQVPVGRPPRTRADVRRKLVWILPWLVFLGSPVNDLGSGRHTAAGAAAGWAGLACFTATYLALV